MRSSKLPSPMLFFSLLLLPFAFSARQSVEACSSLLARRVSCNKRLQQSCTLPSRSFPECAIPAGERLAQNPPPGSQIAEPLFQGRQLFACQLADLVAWSAPAIAFAKN